MFVISPPFCVRTFELLPFGPHTHPSFQPHANMLSHSIFGCSSGSNRGVGSHPRDRQNRLTVHVSEHSALRRSHHVLPFHTWRHSNPLPAGFNWMLFQGRKGTSPHCCCHSNRRAGILCVHVQLFFPLKASDCMLGASQYVAGVAL